MPGPDVRSFLPNVGHASYERGGWGAPVMARRRLGRTRHSTAETRSSHGWFLGWLPWDRLFSRWVEA